MRASKKTPELRSGDVVKIHRKIREGAKERVQVFEGIVIAVKALQSSSPLLTVRRVSHGVGVEIIVPILSPAVEKIEVIKRAKTRQAKLYYLRKKDFKLSKLKMKELDQFAAKEEPSSITPENNAAGEKGESAKDANKSVQKESVAKPEESEAGKSMDAGKKPEKA